MSSASWSHASFNEQTFSLEKSLSSVGTHWIKKTKDIQISLSHCSCSTYNLKQSTKSHRDHCHCPAWSNASSKAPQAATSGAGPTWPDATLSGAGILRAYQVEPPKWLLESCTSGGGSRWVRDVTPYHDTHFMRFIQILRVRAAHAEKGAQSLFPVAGPSAGTQHRRTSLDLWIQCHASSTSPAGSLGSLGIKLGNRFILTDPTNNIQ